MKHQATEPKQVSDKESEILLALARESLRTSGDLVELGCYRGDTSLLLARMLKDTGAEKRLFIYDSFAGLPEKVAQDSSSAGEAFQKGELFVTKREVVERFKHAGLKLPVIRKGFFEELSDDDLPSEICFAFLDGDLYTSIKTSLALVGPRMAEGGVIVVHDYNNVELPGVARAVDEWLKSSAGKNQRLTVRETLAIIR